MAENKLFVNPKTGQMSATQDADFTQDLDTYTPAQPSSPVPTTATVAPATPPPAITTEDIITPPAGVATAANKRGTFVSYDPVTGLASNRRALDIGQQGMNDYLETAINGAEYSKNPDQFVITSKNANTLYGFKKPPKQETATTQTAQANAPTQTADPYPDMENTGNPYMDSLINSSNQYGDEIVRRLAENEDLDTEIDTQNEVVSAIYARMLKMEADLDLENINQSISSMALKEEYYTGKDTIKGNARQMLGDVSSKLTELSSRINEAFDKKAVQEAVTNATNLYQYHLVQNDYNVATGKLQQLEQDSRENADMIFKYQTAMNDISANLFNMDMQTKELKQKEIDREYEMAMQGYSYVPNLAALQELAKKKGTDWVEANTTKIGGKIWIKPDNSKKVVNTIDVGGQLWGLNENGEKIVNYGSSGGFGFSEDEDGSTIVTNTKTGEVRTIIPPKNANTLLGNATITGANGSSQWANGLDMVLDGGYGADVATPFAGTLIEIKTSDKGFGNQVKIRTEFGDELWLSHLKDINVSKIGTWLEAGTVVGTQGNSGTVTDMNGNVYGASQKAQGRGTHLDITMKYPSGKYYTAQEVLAKVSQKADPALEAYQKAFNFLSSGMSEAQRKASEKEFESMTKTGNKSEMQEYILKLAIDTAPTEQKNKAFGRAEALSALIDIDDSLNDYISAGGDTNVFTGKMEDIANKVGATKDPVLARIGTEIRMAMIDYRKAVSGAAFTESESAEYERIFPSIGKVKSFNDASIKALRNTFERNQESFLSTMIGSGNYNKIFAGDAALSTMSNADFFASIK